MIKSASTAIFLTMFFAIIIAMTISGSANAQSTKQRLSAIEKQLNAIQRQVFTPGSRFRSGSGNQGGNATNAPVGEEGGLIADINIRISELETQIRDLTGSLEEANFKVGNLTRQLESMVKDNEFRFSELEKGGVTFSGNTPAIDNSAPSIGSAAAQGTVKQQYDHAYGLVSKGQYGDAEISLLDFLNNNPDHALSGNAQYWLGQTYYARENYSDATRTFLEGMSKYPESPKAPAFLLKVGMSLNFLGEKSEACEVYRELSSRFPGSMENKRMRPVEERKAGCS